MKVLILGGTSEARELAQALAAQGHEVITSLAGRTSNPNLPAGEVRAGAFGGVAGLRDYLHTTGIEWLIDVTHPYAGRISANAVAAASQAGVPVVRLTRQEWVEPAEAGWIHVEDIDAAAAAIPAGSVALVTSGHGGLKTILKRIDCRLIVRLIEPPEFPLPSHARLLLDRPPYGVEDERKLFETEGVTVLVSKNSGGTATEAKLTVAAERGVTVVMVDRPSLPEAEEATSVEEVLQIMARG